MFTKFWFILLYCLLQSSFLISASSSDSSEESFCSHSPEARKICQSMKKFFKHGWTRDNPVDLSQPKCRKCMADADDPILKNVPPHLQDFARKIRSITCQASGSCKPEPHHSDQGHGNSHGMLGMNKCSWGPSYWCRSMDRADECGTHGHCDKVWAAQSLLSEYHDGTCIECQRVISHLHFYGDEHNMYDNGLLKGRNLNTLRNMSLNGVSPAVQCYHMGYCDGKLTDKVLDGNECTWAHAIWLRTRELYAQGYHDFSEIMDKLLDECNVDVAACQRTVFHVLPVFILKYGQYLTDDDIYSGETPCVDVQLCRPGLSNKIYCDVCLTIMASAKRALQHNTSIELIRKIMKGVCPLLGNKREECEDYVDRHIEKWVDDVDAKVDPVAICEDLKLCAKPNNTNSAVTEFPPTFNVCEQCEKFVTRMRMKLICPVKKFFNFVLAQMCRFLGPLQNRCTLEVDSLKDSLVSLISAFIETSKICSPFCNSSDIMVAPDQFTIDWLSKEAAKRICALDYGCQRKTSELLKRVLTWADQTDCSSIEALAHDDFCLHSKESMCKACRSLDTKALVSRYEKSPKEIKRYIAQMCPREPYNEVCTIFADKYETEIARLMPKLIESDQPDQLCDRLGVCRTEDNCMICALVSKEIRKLLPRNSEITEDSVKKALSSVCDNISTVYYSECLAFVDNFEKTIVALLTKRHQSLNGLCRSMGVCHVDVNSVSMSACEICRFTVEAVERAVSTNSSEEQIIEWLNAVCHKLPKNYQEKCYAMIHDNLPMLIEFLKSLVDPDIVCMKLGLCGPNATHCEQDTFKPENYCPLCEMAMVKLRPWAERSGLVKLLRPYLEDICIHQLPNEYHDDCRQDPLKRLCNIIKICPLDGSLLIP